MEKIKTELKNLCLEIIQSNGTKHQEWLDKTAKLYEKLLVLEYLDIRETKLNTISNSAKEKLEEIINSSENNIAPQPNIAEKKETAIKKQEQPNTMGLGDEVKILPHPEGPPPSPKQKDIEETIQEIEQEVQKVAKPQELFDIAEVAPKKVEPVQAEVKKMNIAEMAISNGANNASLNDRLSNKSLKFGLNDRIAFVKHLFNGSQEDFNRVVSQLNTFVDFNEAEQFILHIVKPEYSWLNKEEYENRFMELVRNKF